MENVNVSKVVFVVPCTSCGKLNRVEATMKAEQISREDVIKEKTKATQGEKKDGTDKDNRTESRSVQSDTGKGKTPATDGKNKAEGRKSSK